MALYIGNQKIAGGGGSGNANIVSCDSYDDYVAKRDANIRAGKLSISYYTPDDGASLFGYALLSADNVFIGKNTFTAISAKMDLPEDSALSDKTLMLTDGSGSYNVCYDRLSATDTQYGTIKVAVVDELPDPLLPDVFYFVKEN